jgi:uncharacterized protein YuzE
MRFSASSACSRRPSLQKIAAESSKHLADGIAADYDSEGRLAGIEILDAQKRFGGRETMRGVEVEGFGSVTAPLSLREEPPKEYGG